MNTALLLDLLHSSSDDDSDLEFDMQFALVHNIKDRKDRGSEDDMPSADSYPFTRPMTMRLIELYKEREFMWNKYSQDYNSRTLRRDAMDGIARELALPDLEARHVRLRLRTLRDMYIRELKRRASGLYKSSPYWFHSLHKFLGRHSRLYDTPEDMENVEYLDTSFAGDDSRDESITVVKQELDSYNVNEIVIVQAKDSLKEEPKQRAELEVDPMEMPSSSQTTDDVLMSIESTQRDILEAVQSRSSDGGDYFDNFAKYIASLLRSLPKSRAYALQPKIVSMITSEHIKLVENSNDD